MPKQTYYMRALLLALVLLISGVSRVASASFNWKENANFQYAASVNTVSDKVTWSNAASICAREGASLLTIKSQAEQDFIISSVVSTQATGHIWIGASDRNNEGQFIWQDGTSATKGKARFSSWNGQEPNNSGDCAAIWKDQNGMWDDVDCGELFHFICKKCPKGYELREDECIAPTTSFNWKENANFQYALVSDKATWSTAAFICARDGASLLSIKSQAEHEFVSSSVVSTRTSHTWIGASRSEGQWIWQDGTSATKGQAMFSKWAGGEPNYSGACAAIWKDSKGEWDDIGCGELFPFICKKCPKGHELREDQCIASTMSFDWKENANFQYAVVSDKVTWSNAAFICAQDGASLLSIKSQAEQDFISDSVHLNHLSAQANHWIGASDADNEGQWIWEDGTSAKKENQAVFSSWAANEPGGYRRGAYDCAVLWYEENWDWDDVDCGRWYPFICKKCPAGYKLLQNDQCTPNTTTTTATTTTYQPQSCHGEPEAAGCGTRIPIGDCSANGVHQEFAETHCPVMCGLKCTSTSTTTTTSTTVTTSTTSTTTITSTITTTTTSTTVTTSSTSTTTVTSTITTTTTTSTTVTTSSTSTTTVTSTTTTTTTSPTLLDLHDVCDVRADLCNKLKDLVCQKDTYKCLYEPTKSESSIADEGTNLPMLAGYIVGSIGILMAVVAIVLKCRTANNSGGLMVDVRNGTLAAYGNPMYNETSGKHASNEVNYMDSNGANVESAYMDTHVPDDPALHDYEPMDNGYADLPVSATTNHGDGNYLNVQNDDFNSDDEV